MTTKIGCPELEFLARIRDDLKHWFHLLEKQRAQSKMIILGFLKGPFSQCDVYVMWRLRYIALRYVATSINQLISTH